MGARIGIDLGTTNSVAAAIYDDGPHPIPRHDAAASIVPSIVYFRWQSGRDDVVVGREADQQVGRVVRSVKRLMGRTYDEAIRQGAATYFPGGDVALVREAGNDLRLAIAGPGGPPLRLWPHDVSALILGRIKAHAEQALGAAVDHAVITVPAYFQDQHRQATLEAARSAGLNVLEPLLDEPTAAALAYSHAIGLAVGEPLFVIDWGGGTLDLTVLVHDNEEWVQLAVDGDLDLGGDDVDRALIESLLARRGVPLAVLDDAVALHKLLAAARVAKHTLSTNSVTTLTCGGLTHPGTGRPLMLAETVTAEEFNTYIQPLIARVVRNVKACLAHPHVPADAIRNVLLVGGSTRIPLLRRALEELPGMTIHQSVDPMSAIAIGAALYSSVQRPKLFRLCPYGYAVEVEGELIEVIPPDQEVPTPAALPYRMVPEPRTRYDHQTVYRLLLHRFTRHDRHKRPGASPGVRLFGRGFPPSPANSPVAVELWLDVNKVLHARMQPPGGGPPRDVTVSMAEIGAEAIRTQLQDRTLEAEAVIEVNTQRAGAPLMDALRPALRQAEACLELNDRAETEAALGRLDDLLQRLTSAQQAAGAPQDESERRRRVLSWVEFYEQIVLPRGWDLLAPETRRTAIEDVRRVRIMATTGASPAELWEALITLRVGLETGRAGPVFAAQARAASLGLGAQEREELDALIDAAIDQWQSEQTAAFDVTCRVMVQKTQAADAQLAEWSQSSGVQVGDPTLVVPGARTGE